MLASKQAWRRVIQGQMPMYDYFLFFSDRGRVYWRKVYQLPQFGRTARGRALAKVVTTQVDDARLTHILRVEDFDDRFLVTATAKGLIKTEFIDISDEPTQIVMEFRTRFYDTEVFFDKYARGKFANYLFRRHEQPCPATERDTARRLIEEAQLFLEATHACQARLASMPSPPKAGTAPSPGAGLRAVRGSPTIRRPRTHEGAPAASRVLGCSVPNWG